MSTNPWAAPADLADSPAESAPRSLWDLPWLLFRFDGRIPRRAYWGGFLLTALVFYAGLTVVALVAGSDHQMAAKGMLVLYVPLIWTQAALQVKRWHDQGKSGWWYLVGLVPLAGPLFVLGMCGCMRGDVGANAYGADLT